MPLKIIFFFISDCTYPQGLAWDKDKNCKVCKIEKIVNLMNIDICQQKPNTIKTRSY